MAKSRTTFQKRQKELARMEKQREKVARRQQRRLAGKQPQEPDIEPQVEGELTNPAPAETGVSE